MSTFSEGMNLSIKPAMDQMAEPIEVDGEEYMAIFDPVEVSNRRVPGGKMHLADAIIYMDKETFAKAGIKKGTKIYTLHATLRVESIERDGSDLFTLNCSGPMKGVIPR